MRANNSGGPLARGVSMYLFSHAPVESKCAHFRMPADTFEQLLDRAATQLGIEPGYWDIWGRRHDTTSAAKQAILKALGIAAGDAGELEQSLAALNRREWERLAPPAVVSSDTDEQELPLNVPVESLGEPSRLV